MMQRLNRTLILVFMAISMQSVGIVNAESDGKKRTLNLPMTPGESIRSGSLLPIVKELVQLYCDPVPPKGAFFKVETRFYHEEKEVNFDCHFGLLIGENDDRYILKTMAGTTVEIRKAYDCRIPMVRVRGRTNGFFSVQGRAVSKAKAMPYGDLVDSIVDPEPIPDIEFEETEEDPDEERILPVALFNPYHSLPMPFEITLCIWLYTFGEFDLAGEILAHELEFHLTDENFLKNARRQFREVCEKKMLISFIGDRDFTRALELAKFLLSKFPDSSEKPKAKRLEIELPRRMEDFISFRLPTVKEWVVMREGLARDFQIRFLCERMRLLNCFQFSQPGGIHFSDSQHAEPQGLSGNAAWRLRWGGAETVNPFLALMGDEIGEHSIRLTLDDIPILTEYLRNDWTILAAGFWRDFHDKRTFYSTRNVFSRIINHIAGKDICHGGNISSMSQHEVEDYISHIQMTARSLASKK